MKVKKRIHKVIAFALTAAMIVPMFIGATVDAKAAGYEKVGSKTVAQVLGIDATNVLNWLASHENDEYYLTTPYKYSADSPLGHSDWRNPKGEPNNPYCENTGVGMQCTGFVWHVLWKAGATPSDIPHLGAHHNGSYSEGGWVTWMNREDVLHYNFDSKEDMLNSGLLEKGDIIWSWDGGMNNMSDYHHVGFYYGTNSSGQHLYWHSGPRINCDLNTEINCISTINSKVSTDQWTIVKLGEVYGSASAAKVSSNASITTGNPYYDLNGTTYDIFNNANSKVGTFIINSDGSSNEVKLVAGNYYCVETAAGKGYELDKETHHPFTVSAGQKTSVSLSDTPLLGSLELNKKSELPKITDDNRCYSLKGATYDVIAKKAIGTAYAAGDVVTTLKTDENGYAKSKPIPYGDYTVKETKAPKNYMIETKTHNVTINVENDNEMVLSTDVPSNDPMAIEIFKIDQDSGVIAQGGASLAGAEFTVSYYDTTGYNSVKSLEANETPKRTWVLKTIKNKAGKYICTLNDNYKVSGDDFYLNKNGKPTLPIGTITVEETKAPNGYLLNGKKLYVADKNGDPIGDVITEGKFIGKILQDENLVGKLQGGNYYAQSDVVKRGDISFSKMRESSEQLSVPFKISSLDENGEVVESHIIYTDGNGIYDSSAVTHSTNTNGWDSSSDPNAAIGTWFGMDDQGNATAVDDSRGAFPYGTYILEEQACEANEGLELITRTFVVNRDRTEISSDSKTIDLGTLIDKDTPDIVIGTTATDQETGSHFAMAKAGATIVDRVSYNGIKTGKNYTLITKLMNRTTKEMVSGVEVTTTLNSDTTEGYIDVNIPVDATALEGQDVVVYEYLYDANKLVASHEDIGDDYQTIHFPTIGTTATDANSGMQSGKVSENTTIIDKVAFANIQQYHEYRIVTKLADKETGDLIEGAEAETTFSSKTTSGSTNAQITFDSTPYEGKSVVVYEYVYDGDVLIASHEDLADENQTVNFPKIGTTLTSDGDSLHHAPATEKVTLTDTITYTNLIPNKEYKVTGVLYDKATGKPAKDDNGQKITAEETFTPDTPDGTVDVTFEFSGVSLAGTSAVAFETVSYNGKELAVHADINDADQLVTFPKVGTTAVDRKTETHFGEYTDKMSLVDTIAYEGMNENEGLTYVAVGELYDPETEKSLGIKNAVKFTPKESSGTVDLAFDFTKEDLTGHSVVVVERIYEAASTVTETDEAVEDDKAATEETKEVTPDSAYGATGDMIASHEDLTDEMQKVYYPEIGTTAIDAQTGSHMSFADNKVTITDTIAYSGLKAGEKYTVTGTLMDKETKKALTVGKEPVTKEEDFVAEKADGTFDITFEFDASLLNGKTLVAFEEIALDGKVIAKHEDIEDEDQTVHVPDLHTSAKDKEDGDNKLTRGQVVTIVDTVSYSNVIPGQKVTVVGVLMDKETKKAVVNNGKVITNNVTFEPKNESGQVEVEFTFDDSEYVGNDLVVFEKMYINTEDKPVKELTSDAVIAAHEDINDAAQTVSIKTTLLGNKVPQQPADTTTTRTSPKTGDMMIWYFIAAGAVAGGILVLLKKGKKQEAKA